MCPTYNNETRWKEFLKKARRENKEMKADSVEAHTVLNDKVIWNFSLMTAVGARPDDGQLKRCKKHKKVEAEYLLDMPEGVAFCDVGAHFGDTVITHAVHARKHKRDDIRFFAFEPNKIKANFIRQVAKDNQLDITVVNTAVSDKHTKCREKKDFSKERAVWNGSLAYDTVSGDSSSGDIDMITLDSMKEMISPIGILHLDIEGHEAKAILGARDILSEAVHGSVVIAEVWNKNEQYRRGLGKDADPENDIVTAIDGLNFQRQEDIMDMERNVVFKKKKVV